MTYNPDRPARKSPRLSGYNYSQNGAYFVTINAIDNHCIFGDIVDGKMKLTVCGEIAQRCWDELPKYYKHIELDAFIIMPNHVHGIILIFEQVPKHGLSEIIRAFKSYTTRRVNHYERTSNRTIWHRSYHDVILRSEKDLNTRRQYIELNPQRWADDDHYVGR
jgi:putative transposase